MQTPPPLVIPSMEELKITNTYRNKFEKISDEIRKQPHKINVAHTGEIILNGKVIPNSSFNNLIRGLFIRNKDSNNQGDEAFIKFLNDINISPELISHRVPKNIYHSLLTPNITGTDPPEEYSSFFEEGKEQEEEHVGNGKRSKSKNYSLKIHPPPGKRPRILWLYR